MKKTLFSLFTVLVVILMLFALTACGAANDEEQAAEPAADEAENEAVEAGHTVTDYDGNVIELPDEIDYVCPGVNSMSQITAMLGGADKIVAAGSSIMKNDFFRKVFPQFDPQYGNDNVEDVLASGAQVVYGPMKDDNLNAQYEAAGVPFVYLGGFANIDEILWTISTIGDILGGDAPEKAQAFIDYFNHTMDDIQAKTDEIPEADRLRVVALSYREGSYSIGMKNSVQNSYLEAVGGKLCDAETRPSTSKTL